MCYPWAADARERPRTYTYGQIPPGGATEQVYTDFLVFAYEPTQLALYVSCCFTLSLLLGRVRYFLTRP